MGEKEQEELRALEAEIERLGAASAGATNILLYCVAISLLLFASGSVYVVSFKTVRESEEGETLTAGRGEDPQEATEVEAGVQRLPSALRWDESEMAGWISGASGEKTVLGAVYARIRDKKGSSTQKFDRFALPARTLAAAFFKEPLAEDSVKKLQHVPDLLKQSTRAVGQKPELVLEVDIPAEHATCTVENFHSGRIRALIGGSAKEVKISPADLGRSGALALLCDYLEKGQDITVAYKSEPGKLDQLAPGIAFELDKRTALHVYSPIGNAHYKDFAAVQALWRKASGRLDIGFYSVFLSNSDLVRIRESASLQALPQKQPDVIVEIPLAAKIKVVTPESVEAGYSMRFLKHEQSPITFPGEEEGLTVALPPGAIPPTLSGVMIEGKRLIGRFSGSTGVALESGEFVLDWDFAYNTTLIAVP